MVKKGKADVPFHNSEFSVLTCCSQSEVIDHGATLIQQERDKVLGTQHNMLQTSCCECVYVCVSVYRCEFTLTFRNKNLISAMN